MFNVFPEFQGNKNESDVVPLTGTWHDKIIHMARIVLQKVSVVSSPKRQISNSDNKQWRLPANMMFLLGLNIVQILWSKLNVPHGQTFRNGSVAGWPPPCLRALWLLPCFPYSGKATLFIQNHLLLQKRGDRSWFIDIPSFCIWHWASESQGKSSDVRG